MRNLIPCVLLAACASSPDGADATTPTEPRSAVTIFDRAQSKNRFEAWLADIANARTRRCVSTSSNHPQATTPRSSRIAQIRRHFASTLARAEIPADVRTGEHVSDKTAAYCDGLATAALPLLAKADEAAITCAEVATKLAPGWWSSVCVE
jgi:hypothetical protein